MDAIRPLADATRRAGVVGGLGGFGAIFDLRAAGYTDPLIIAATDGVGTKLKIAIAAGRHETIGIDLVAMCVNDLIVQGAEPLFFLDYFGTGRLEADVGRAVVAGIADGCAQAGCALIGGETAELPGLYAAGDYDLAGFALGAVERDGLITGSRVKAGDTVLGLASDGLHANGFSLVRSIVSAQGLGYDEPAPFAPDTSLAEALLVPTRIYVRSLLPALATGRVKAMAHITGGGLTENLPRVLPDGLGVRLDAGSWTVPPVFRWLAATGDLDAATLATTFNVGIGMAIIADSADTDGLCEHLTASGESVRRIGQVTATRGQRVVIDNTDQAWTEKAWLA